MSILMTNEVWSMIENEVFAQTNKRYIVPKLKSKFNSLHKKDYEFSDLIEYTGFEWDHIANTVTVSDDVLANYIKVLFNFTYYYFTLLILHWYFILLNLYCHFFFCKEL